MTNPVYKLTLHRTYFDKGFFNLGVSVDALVMSGNGPVVIELGGAHRTTEGRIDRSANLNGTPRIHGGAELRNWFQANCQMGDHVDVKILAPDRLRITFPCSGSEETLEKLGFQKVSEWVLSEGRIKPKTLDWEECSSWLYAFVVDGKPRYFGITGMVLRSRLDHYSYQHADRVQRLIMAELNAGRAVEILALRRIGFSEQERAREESRLIDKYGTDWNIRR